jgi:protein required for attachment to host cells
MAHTIILAADKARARLFTRTDHLAHLDEVQTIHNPAARLREQDLVTGASGGNPHDIGSQGDAHAYLAESFAREVNLMMEQFLTLHEAGSVLVISPPRFLGFLRAQWSPLVKSRITHEYAKEVSQLSAQEIAILLQKWL